ncbi:MAG: SAM-dependent methyltransferase [Crocinitomicaceae bacterium]|nr:SAM-dependent methyltransferase [Crocinitomicaceae bacterium]
MDFSNHDIADYYNQTQVHYKQWWKLANNQSVHYGLWEKDTRSFAEALQNTNRVMSQIAGIKPGEKILDAGCGVGGAAFYLSKNMDCEVVGITLSEKQLEMANQHKGELNTSHKVQFDLKDFSNTDYPDHSFDVIWACESSCYANPKSTFLNEVNRLLKPGGRLILADYFLTDEGEKDPNGWLKKWGDLWAISDFYKNSTLNSLIEENGLSIISNQDFSAQVQRSSKRMYCASILAAPFSECYNLFFNTSRFAKHHYRSAIYQFRSLMKQQWQYRIICAKIGT